MFIGVCGTVSTCHFSIVALNVVILVIGGTDKIQACKLCVLMLTNFTLTVFISFLSLRVYDTTNWNSSKASVQLNE